MKPEKVEPSPSLHSTASSEVECGPRSLLEDLHLPHSTTHLSPPSNGSFPKRIHVSNIPFKWREGDLHNLFSSFGEIKDVSIVTNERGSKGYGFVTFLNSEAADEAIEALSGRNFSGRTILVSAATTRRNDMIRNDSIVRTGSSVAGTGNTKYSAELGALLLQQKQMLAQQHLQQYLIAQQNSDLIASALGLPTSNLTGLLGGSLPYPTSINLPGLDPLSLQVLILFSLKIMSSIDVLIVISHLHLYFAAAATSVAASSAAVAAATVCHHGTAAVGCLYTGS
ncbi:hypothetical protein PRIPAC_72081 [Pristionchus pacificus]|uniref:RNA binding protein n=1 Tax=Pristionchus pacificus TaxID=54126 RepID=A0A2A6CGP3_PRIPA|nr:hypothetical protein PRIPAC_72081 [Pristionchus pacificus]|eukprot:PDM77266.1 RNA binding protein [Pristionchus pacificus]